MLAVLAVHVIQPSHLTLAPTPSMNRPWGEVVEIATRWAN